MKKLKNKKSRNTGITLIALVVTIIILIILATISINIIVGENGLIAQAERAKGVYESSADREQGIMDQYANIVANGGKIPEKLKTVAEVIESETPFTETKQITDGNGDLMWVPKDFKVVEGESIDTGVVIEDGVGNQFVWVPVPDIDDMYDSANKAGKLYDFSGEGSSSTSKARTYPGLNSGYREPDIVTGSSTGTGTEYDGADSNLAIIQQGLTATTFKSKLQSDFDKMIESVGYYKGFYIGRYETGNLKSGQVTTAVVKKDREDISNTNWYYMYASSKDIVYKNETEKITSVTSSMIWGCQWDATLNWFIRSDPENTRGVKGYVTNSTGKGWYKENSEDSKKPTGTPISDKKENEVNKIWDMAGNVHEWTLEAYNSDARVNRGGSYGGKVSISPAIDRNTGVPTYYRNNYGSRVTLYITK